MTLSLVAAAIEKCEKIKHAISAAKCFAESWVVGHRTAQHPRWAGPGRAGTTDVPQLSTAFPMGIYHFKVNSFPVYIHIFPIV